MVVDEIEYEFYWCVCIYICPPEVHLKMEMCASTFSKSVLKCDNDVNTLGSPVKLQLFTLTRRSKVATTNYNEPNAVRQKLCWERIACGPSHISAVTQLPTAHAWGTG